LAKLVAADGSLAVAFRLEGPIDEPAISLDPAFAAAVERAKRGENTEPFVAPPASPLELKLEPLEEQLGF